MNQNETQPTTGQPCTCRAGSERDNCRHCEGTGMRVDFAAIRQATAAHRLAIEPAQGWPYPQMGRIYSEKAETWVEVSEEFFDEMLNVLPPIGWNGERFLVGEPYTHNAQGRAVFAGLVRTHGRFFARYSTPADFPELCNALRNHLNTATN